MVIKGVESLHLRAQRYHWFLEFTELLHSNSAVATLHFHVCVNVASMRQTVLFNAFQMRIKCASCSNAVHTEAHQAAVQVQTVVWKGVSHGWFLRLSEGQKLSVTPVLLCNSVTTKQEHTVAEMLVWSGVVTHKWEGSALGSGLYTGPLWGLADSSCSPAR